MFDIDCLICHEPYEKTDDICATQCGHIFHRNCINSWLKASMSCPKCRKICYSTNIFKLFLEISDNASGLAEIQLRQQLALCEESRASLRTEFKKLQVEYKRLQTDLNNERHFKKILEMRVTELYGDKLVLTDKVHHLVHENRLMRMTLTEKNTEKESTKKQMTELERKLEKEIQDRSLSQQRFKVPKYKSNTSPNSNRNDGNTYEIKDIAADGVLYGIPEIPSQDLEAIFIKLCHTIHCVPPDLKAIYRYRYQNQSESPIIVKFATPNAMNIVLSGLSIYRIKMNRQVRPQDIGIDSPSTKGIYMSQNLTSKNRYLLELAFDLKHQDRLFSVYTQFGSVYVKQSEHGPGVRIENEQMLKAFADPHTLEADCVKSAKRRVLSAKNRTKNFQRSLKEKEVKLAGLTSSEDGASGSSSTTKGCQSLLEKEEAELGASTSLKGRALGGSSTTKGCQSLLEKEEAELGASTSLKGRALGSSSTTKGCQSLLEKEEAELGASTSLKGRASGGSSTTKECQSLLEKEEDELLASTSSRDGASK